MATSAKKNTGETSRDVGVIGVRLLDDAHMAWIAAEVDSGTRFALDRSGWVHRVATYPAYRAAVDREEAPARDLRRLRELTQPHQERLAHSS